MNNYFKKKKFRKVKFPIQQDSVLHILSRKYLNLINFIFGMQINLATILLQSKSQTYYIVIQIDFFHLLLAFFIYQIIDLVQETKFRERERVIRREKRPPKSGKQRSAFSFFHSLTFIPPKWWGMPYSLKVGFQSIVQQYHSLVPSSRVSFLSHSPSLKPSNEAPLLVFMKSYKYLYEVYNL